jgi:hypothetical protein
MPLNAHYLKELSALFVEDLKRSDYYRTLPENQRLDLDDRLASEASQGLYPLLPGADEAALQRLSEALHKKLHLQLPACVVDILRQVDGFSENGVALFGVDGVATGDPVVLHKSTLKQAHRFSTMEELVNDMMQQALGDFGDEPVDPEDEPGNHSAGFHFSRN